MLPHNVLLTFAGLITVALITKIIRKTYDLKSVPTAVAILVTLWWLALGVSPRATLYFFLYSLAVGSFLAFDAYRSLKKL